MTTLPSTYGASPLDAIDASYASFANDTDGDIITNALDNMPSDFDSMDTGLAWHVSYSVVGRSDDTYGLSVRIINGATILAAATSGGTPATVNANVTNTSDTTGSVAFAYVNTGASKALWDGATWEFTQAYSKSKGSDGGHIRLNAAWVTGTYTAGAAAQDLTASLITSASAIYSPTLSTVNTLEPTLLGGGGGYATIVRESFIDNDDTYAGSPVDTVHDIDAPAGFASGDVVVVDIQTNGSSLTTPIPTGFVQMWAAEGQSNPKSYGFVGTYDDVGAGPWTFHTTSSVYIGWIAARYSGVDNTTPQDATAVGTDGAAATSWSLTGITTSTDGAMVVGGVGSNSSSAARMTWDSAQVVAEFDETFLGGGIKDTSAADGTQATAGATGAITGTIDSTLAWAGGLAALKPAATGGGGGAEIYSPTISHAAGPATQDLTASLITSTSAIYAPTVVPDQLLSTSLIDGGAAIYSPTVIPDQLLSPTLLDGGAAIYDATVVQTVPSQDITAVLLTSTSAIYGPTLSTLNALAPTLLDGGAAIYAPTLTTENTLTATLLTSTSAIYDATVEPAPESLTATLLDGGRAIYAPTVVPDLLLTPTLLDGGATPYSPTVQPAPVTVTTALLTSASQIYDAEVIPGPLSLSPTLLGSAPAIYDATVIPDQPLAATFIASNPAIYAPALGLSLAADLITSTSAIYDVSLELNLTLDLISSTPVAYGPTVAQASGPQSLIVPLLDANHAIYAPGIFPDQQLTVPLLDGGATLYDPAVLADQAITAAFITSTSAIYDPTLTAYVDLVTTLLDGGATPYDPTITNSSVSITGITRDGSGTPLGSCVVHVFRTVDDVEVAQVTSSSTGAFSVSVAAGVEHYIVAYKAGTPDKAGTTKNTLVGS